MEIPALAISSTDIRARVKRGRPIRYLVPEALSAISRRRACTGDGGDEGVAWSGRWPGAPSHGGGRGAVVLVRCRRERRSRLGDAAGGAHGGGTTRPFVQAVGKPARSTRWSRYVTIPCCGDGSGHAQRRPPSFFSVPSIVLTPLPPWAGRGDVLGGRRSGRDSVRVAASNMFGAWAEHVAVVDLDGLAAVVDRGKGAPRAGSRVLRHRGREPGPGAARLTGEQVVALLNLQEEGGEARWASVVQALLREPVPSRRGGPRRDGWHRGRAPRAEGRTRRRDRRVPDAVRGRERHRPEAAGSSTGRWHGCSACRAPYP